eukprot:766051-Hanusia_phi.AAC.5
MKEQDDLILRKRSLKSGFPADCIGSRVGRGQEGAGTQHFEIRHIRNASNDSTDSKRYLLACDKTFVSQLHPSSSRSSSSSASQNVPYPHRSGAQKRWKLGWRSWGSASSYMDGANQTTVKSMGRVWTSTVDPSVSSDGAIWCMKFDMKGEFVATGGQVEGRQNSDLRPTDKGCSQESFAYGKLSSTSM